MRTNYEQLQASAIHNNNMTATQHTNSLKKVFSIDEFEVLRKENDTLAAQLSQLNVEVGQIKDFRELECKYQ